MKLFILIAALTLTAVGCSKQSETAAPRSAAFPPRLQSYFEQYCDETGGLGIGFDSWHTYTYRFRQQLKMSDDPELKRLFVIQNLYRELDLALDNFEKGIVITGKSSSRPLTPSEWKGTQESIQTRINDLAAYVAFTNFARASYEPADHFDPGLERDWIQELRGRLTSVTNGPAPR